jgi:hypothetical protein
MLPSPSLGPPLLSASWSPPLPCGMPFLMIGGAVVGGGSVIVVGGVVAGGVVAGGVVGGGCGTVDVVGGGPVVCAAGVAGGCPGVAACELDMSANGRTIAAAITDAIRTEMIATRLVTWSPQIDGRRCATLALRFYANG